MDRAYGNRPHHSDDVICEECVGDVDLRSCVAGYDGEPGCSFCGLSDAPTMPLAELLEFMTERIREFYDLAAENLPYESAEGGYQGWTALPFEIVFDEWGLELPRDRNDVLRNAIERSLDDDLLCEHAWTMLSYDERMKVDWHRFSEIVKSERRFFFHQVGATGDPMRESRAPVEFLTEIASLIESYNLIRTLTPGYVVFRARSHEVAAAYINPSDLGPPPTDCATMSQRMSPPGIPMFYGAETCALAQVEVGCYPLSIGKFETLRQIRILDLVNLPPVPGYFSDADRTTVLSLRFLRDFSDLIALPVGRDDRPHIDYIPTQVFTEYLRDYAFENGPIDGIKYRSAKGVSGANVVFFASQADIEGGLVVDQFDRPKPWLRLLGVCDCKSK